MSQISFSKIVEQHVSWCRIVNWLTFDCNLFDRILHPTMLGHIDHLSLLQENNPCRVVRSCKLPFPAPHVSSTFGLMTSFMITVQSASCILNEVKWPVPFSLLTFTFSTIHLSILHHAYLRIELWQWLSANYLVLPSTEIPATHPSQQALIGLPPPCVRSTLRPCNGIPRYTISTILALQAVDTSLSIYQSPTCDYRTPCIILHELSRVLPGAAINSLRNAQSGTRFLLWLRRSERWWKRCATTHFVSSYWVRAISNIYRPTIVSQLLISRQSDSVKNSSP